MGVVQDPRDRFTFQAARDFRLSVRPIYRDIAGVKRVQHLASCLLLNVDGVPTVCTAAHVADHSPEWRLSIGGAVGEQVFAIPPDALIKTLSPDGNRDLDHFDYAFWQPPSFVIDEFFAGLEFLDPSRLTEDPPAKNRLYTALGYPYSRNKTKVNHATKTIDTRISMYTAEIVEIPALAAKLGVSGDEHLILSWQPRSFTGDGERMNTFGPSGSGGPLLDLLGEITSMESYERDPRGSARTCGLIVEYDDDHGALIAVKIGVVLQGIRRMRRELL